MCQDIKFPIIFQKKGKFLGPDASLMTNESCIHPCIYLNINDTVCSVLSRRNSMSKGTEADWVHRMSQAKMPGVITAKNSY